MDKRNKLNVAKFTLGAGGYEFAIDGGKVTVTRAGNWVVDEGSAPTEEPTPTTTPNPTTAPTPTPGVSPKVNVRAKVRAGQPMKIRGRDLSVRKVRITLAGKKLAVVKVEDGRFVVTKVVPKNLKGKKVLRVLDRKGAVLVKTTVRVLKRKAA